MFLMRQKVKQNFWDQPLASRLEIFAKIIGYR